MLQVGLGRIGRPIFDEYVEHLDELMAVDPAVDVPESHGWDGWGVDLAVIVVDTPGRDGRYDYSALAVAVGQYARVSRFLLIRSTVGLDFLDHPVYVKHAARIGFAPEFYGTTDASRRGALELGFSIFSSNVPRWFVETVGVGTVLRGSPAEVIVAKLAENAFLATKVTFFHELWVLCEKHALDFESVRAIVTADPRIVSGHSACDGHLGWSSHCFDKDVPVFAGLLSEGGLVSAMLAVNERLLDRS